MRKVRRGAKKRDRKGRSAHPAGRGPRLTAAAVLQVAPAALEGFGALGGSGSGVMARRSAENCSMSFMASAVAPRTTALSGSRA